MAFVVREPSRKVHITRILGTNRAGEVLPDIWLDVERFEVYQKVTQSDAGQYQKVMTKFRWHDDPDDADEYRPENDDGTARNTKVLKVCSPDEEDLNDPEEWVPVRVIKAVHLVHGDDVGSDTNQKYITEDLTAERKVKPRRVSHYDTSIDSQAEAAFEADPARTAYVAQSEDYQKDDDTKDDEQYIEYEIVTAIHKQVSAHAQSFGTDQQVIQSFKNQYLLDETEPALLEEVGENDKNPPYRLDPFQNIVNVNFGVEKQWLLGHDTGFGGPPFATSEDEHSWDEVRIGASGMGRTVLVPRHIVFGNITLPDETKRSCFMREIDKVVSLGFIVDGNLVWETRWTAPDDVRALSYANGRFFVSYDSDTGVRLALTQDGETFTANINPFPGFTDPGGWNVIYRDKKYIMVGFAYAGGNPGPDLYAFNASMLWASSTNGTSWTAGGSTNPYTGIGSGAASQMSTAITAGKDILVAAAAQKHVFPVPFDEDGRNKVLHSSAVAVSTNNGTSWTMVPMPDAEVRSSAVLGDRFSDCFAVAFIKSKEDGGFFVATDYASGGNELTGKARLLKSIDGLTWTEIASSTTPVTGPAGSLDIYITLSAINKTLNDATTIIA